MPDKMNPYTRAVLRAGAFLDGLDERAEAAKPVEFMERRVPLSQARIEWAKMPEAQRRAFMEEHQSPQDPRGIEAALRLVRPAKHKGFLGAAEE